jgi:hypothetical protein
LRNNIKAKSLKEFKKDQKIRPKFVGFSINEEDMEIFEQNARRFTGGNRSALLRIMINEWEPKLDEPENEDEW